MVEEPGSKGEIRGETPVETRHDARIENGDGDEPDNVTRPGTMETVENLHEDVIFREGRGSPQAAPRSPQPHADVTRQQFCTPPVVMSLYGDGFIEVARRDGRAVDLSVPFKLTMTVFKASDASTDFNSVESEAMRHSSPELNDDGEFVRWSCCGSADKSVYGCPMTSADPTACLSLEEHYKRYPPRLLAVKPPQDGSVSFVIFDRGLPPSTEDTSRLAVSTGCRVWWNGYECWARGYNIPENRWVSFTVTFDGQYLRIYVDEILIDTAVAQQCYQPQRLQFQQSYTIGNSSSSSSSLYCGGYTRYSTQVNQWRSRSGFIGLIGEIITNSAHIIPSSVGELKDISSAREHVATMHRNIFWRQVFPPFFEASEQQGSSRVKLLDNFYHGAHNDVSHRNTKSFESLLLAVVQSGDVCVRIERGDPAHFDAHFGSDHGCRTQADYGSKCRAFIRGIERRSPLLHVAVSECAEAASESTSGCFEIFLDLCRSLGSTPVSIPLHSMASTGCFPRERDIKARITEIITHEARRSPGEDIVHQALRHFLSLANEARDNRERVLIEAVMNRKVVITEKRLVAAFQRIGFYFANDELQELIRLFRVMQENVLRHQHRIDDIPTMSLLLPSSSGLYTLPLLRSIFINATSSCERGGSRSRWRFIAVFLNYDLQLIKFIHEGCPQSQLGGALYTQSRYLHGGFVDRLSIQLSDLPSHVYCVLISLKQRNPESSSVSHGKQDSVRVELDNGETLQMLAQFEAGAGPACKWLSLAALYRSRKSMVWRFQALGGDANSATIHGSLEGMHLLLVDRHIVQVYDVIVTYDDDPAHAEYSEFASRFSKNIRFGRNGKIVTRRAGLAQMDHQVTGDSGRYSTQDRPSKLDVSLRIQGVKEEVFVYRHDDASTSIPTIQSICRSILRALAERGVKESLQQNPFVAGAKKLKRSVTIRVTSDDSNAPVPNAYIFVEMSTDNSTAITSLASKIVPTLTMGTRLVSIRKRLQKRKYIDEVKETSKLVVAEAVKLGVRYAMVFLRESRLMPIVKSRALLRRAMQRRRAQIVEKVLAAMTESERSRMYSQSGPVRLQQLFRHELTFSPSEKELVGGWDGMDLDSFRREFGLAPVEDNDGVSAQKCIDEVWHEERSASVVSSGSNQLHASESAHKRRKKPSSQAERATAVTEQPSDVGNRPKRSYMTDANGVATCRLTPGSYSLYVFHNDYFEWTSHVVIFPTANASGLFGGSVSSAVPQEIVVPVETFKWTYGIQLVDFYQQHCAKPVRGVPIVVTDKLTSEQTILQTQADGSVAWDVRKGLYSIRAVTDNTSIIYSGTKNVVVDGGRYHPPRTIFIPVLFGKVTIDVVVSTFAKDLTFESRFATISFLNMEDVRQAGAEGDSQPAVKASQSVLMNSSNQFQLRPGQYSVDVVVEGFFDHSSMIDAPWDCNLRKDVSKIPIVLCPRILDEGRLYAVFSCVNCEGLMDAMLRVHDSQGHTQSIWRNGANTSTNEANTASLDYSVLVEGCTIQAFSIKCQAGFSYALRIACSRVPSRSDLNAIHPRVQIHDSNGLLYDRTASAGDWDQHFCWEPCTWSHARDLTALHSMSS